MVISTSSRLLIAAFAAAVGTVCLDASPRAIPAVDFSTILEDARAVAARSPTRQVVRMDGTSMTPYFRSGSIGVLETITTDRVRRGMIVVYRNDLGDHVAHRVIERLENGWRVQGYNNRIPDSTIVDDSNLIGVLYATFSAPPRATLNRATLAAIESLDVVIGARAR